MIASLLVSVLLVGVKLPAAREIVQIIERRKELKANLSLLRMRLEEDDLVHWLEDVAHDRKQRSARRIAMMTPASGGMYNARESQMVDGLLDLVAQYEHSSAGVTQLKHSPTVERVALKHADASGLPLVRGEFVCRAAAYDIVAYNLNFDSRHLHSTRNPHVDRLDATLEIVNDHHTVIFSRKKMPGWHRERTFLSSIIAKQVVEDPPTFVVGAVPIASHERLAEMDETSAVRAEIWRSSTVTELSPGRSRVTFVSSLNLGLNSFVAKFRESVFANTYYQHELAWQESVQLYFQQLLPLSECEAHDGQVVGRLLKNLVESQPNDLMHATREFSNRTAMLRECGFPMGEFLAGVVSTQPQNVGFSVTADVRDPTRVTKEQAATMGRMLLANSALGLFGYDRHRSSRASSGSQSADSFVRSALDVHPVLHTMHSRYAWFLPMLEVLLVRPVSFVDMIGRRISSRGSLKAVVPGVDADEKEAVAEEEVTANTEQAGIVSLDSPVRFASGPLFAMRVAPPASHSGTHNIVLCRSTV